MGNEERKRFPPAPDAGTPMRGAAAGKKLQQLPGGKLKPKANYESALLRQIQGFDQPPPGALNASTASTQQKAFPKQAFPKPLPTNTQGLASIVLEQQHHMAQQQHQHQQHQHQQAVLHHQQQQQQHHHQHQHLSNHQLQAHPDFSAFEDSFLGVGGTGVLNREAASRVPKVKKKKDEGQKPLGESPVGASVAISGSADKNVSGNSASVVKPVTVTAAAASSSVSASASAASATAVSASASASAPVTSVPKASLPEGWRQASDPKSGRKYYWNVYTKNTQWKRPTTNAEKPLSSDAREFVPELT